MEDKRTTVIIQIKNACRANLTHKHTPHASKKFSPTNITFIINNI